MTKYKSLFGVYALLLVLILVFVFLSPERLTLHHFLNMIRQAAPLGIVAIAQTLVLLVGGIDLSVGAVISLVNVLAAAYMAGSNANILVAVLISLVVSALVGVANGISISKLKIPPFLITLAMSILIEGAYFIYTKGSPKGKIAEGFRFISDGWVGAIPVSLVIWLLIWGIFAFLLYRTVWGRKLYATGGNFVTSAFSGVRVNRITITTYMLSSVLAGISGLMISAYIGVASSGVGTDFTLNSIAATVIGGTAFTGGRGGLAGTFAGVLIMMLLQNLLTMLNVPEAGKFISQGIVIILMLAVNQRRK